MTIAPNLLKELSTSTVEVSRKLSPETSKFDYIGGEIKVDEVSFRYQLNADAMATEKLAEGIRGM